MITAAVTLALAFSGLPAQAGQRLLGASEVIRRAKLASDRPPSTTPLSILADEAASLRAKLPALSAKAAAEGWVSLVRDWERRVPASDYQAQTGWQEVMSALPGPDAWLLIRQGLEKLPAQRTAPIKNLFDDLLGRDEAVLKRLESKRDPNADPAKEDVFSPESKISDAELPIALRVGNLDLVEKIYRRKALADNFGWGMPDLFHQLGRKRAESLLRWMLENTDRQIWTGESTDARALARQIVLNDVARLKSPQWSLASGLDDFDFVAIQVAKFGEKSLQSSGGWATEIYALGLAKRGRLDDAIRILSADSSYGSGLSLAWAGAFGQKADLFTILSQLLDRKPMPSLAPLYAGLGLRLGRAEEVTKRLEAWMSTPNLDPASLRTCLVTKASLDCALGRVDAAIAELEQAIDLQKGTPAYDEGELAQELLGIAKATHNLEAIQFVAERAKSMGTSGSRLDFFDTYNGLGMVDEAQEAALHSMEDVHDVNLGAEGQGRLLNAYPGNGVRLAELYKQRDEPDQILILLHEYPKWGAGDLLSILQTGRSDSSFRDMGGDPLGFYAAWALARTGQTESAKPILRALVRFEPASDSPYELLNEVAGAEALGLYDEITQSDRFKPRPLMWKGDLLLRIGKLDEAENLVRAAIALDPTGQASVSARGILARILHSQGDEAGAEACRKSVEASKVESDAMRAEQANLYSMAATLYEQALKLDPNNSDILLHYAGCLRNIGREEAARAAYQRALESILSYEGPFGGIALSYYYGGFQDEGGHDLTRSIFAKLQVKNHRDPGLLVLIGQLHVLENNKQEALACYEEAVRIDPDYLRAWDGIIAVDDFASRQQTAEAAYALMRLDPLGTHYYYLQAVQKFGDYPSLWRALDKASKSLPPLPKGPLFPLEASKLALAAGAHPAETRPAEPLRMGPGAVFATITELQQLMAP